MAGKSECSPDRPPDRVPDQLIDRPRARRAERLAVAGAILALLCVATALASALANRFELAHFRTTLTLFRWASMAGIAAAAVSLIAAVVALRARSRRALVLSSLGLLVGALIFANAWAYKNKAQSVPPIHDITTDFEDPPSFGALLSERKPGENPTQYGGPEIASQQLRAYPDIKPIAIGRPSREVMAAAYKVAEDMGWRIVISDPLSGRLEATDTTFWFGFKDDVIVRIRAAGGHPEGVPVRIDVRSASRVGVSDLGANAKRVREFIERLKAKVAEPRS